MKRQPAVDVKMIDGRAKVFVDRAQSPKAGKDGVIHGPNRAQRRMIQFQRKTQRLYDNVIEMRKGLIGAGVHLPPMPRKRSRKHLSGYYGQLTELARREVAA